MLEESCHQLDLCLSSTASTRETTFEVYMKAKNSLKELEQEKSQLTNQLTVAQQYLVLQLLTTQNPLQNPVVTSTSDYIKNTSILIAEKVRLDVDKNHVPFSIY